MSQEMLDRKPCPRCGYTSRSGAKYCINCGFAFFLADTNGVLRKRCTHCGWFNRMGAKVCARCGSAFQGIHMVSRGRQQKWCPQCGTERRGQAKVCSQCGYRFKATPVEPPVVQSSSLSEPIQPSTTTPMPAQTPVSPSPPKPPKKKVGLEGEPAPYISNEELERLRRMGQDRRDMFVRLFEVLRDDRR